MNTRKLVAICIVCLCIAVMPAMAQENNTTSNGNETNVTTGGFGKMASVVCSIADRCCEGRLAITLEGGYDLHALSHSVVGVLEVMAGWH